MNFEEFLKPRDGQVPSPEQVVETVDNVETVETESISVEKDEIVEEQESSQNIDVQKAVVESLAADKAVQDEMIASLRKDNYALQTEIATLKQKIAEQSEALSKVGDVLAKNTESQLSSKITLLEREADLPDRFPGETREHVLEVIREARDKAEADGRMRRAQVLEGVLTANEAEGTLAQKRAEIEKLFAENGNIVSGPVIEELTKLGISHKNGEEYLLPVEIIKRSY